MKNMSLLINKDNTLLCSQPLLSSPIGLRLSATAPRHALKLPHFQLHWVYKATMCSQIHQSWLCHLTANTSPSLVSTSPQVCCLPGRPYPDVQRPFLLVSIKRTRDSPLSLPRCACLCTHCLHKSASQVTSVTLSLTLASAIVTFASLLRDSLIDASKCHRNLCKSSLSSTHKCASSLIDASKCRRFSHWR